jgi:predicted RNA-binding protein with PIN domain
VTVRDEPSVEQTTEAFALPESLLVPLLDDAAAVLRTLDVADFPPVLRPLASFGKQGLTTSPARQQLRRAVEVEPEFRRRVVERFVDHPEVRAALEAWDPAQALRRVDEAAARADLALLASTLFAVQPEGWSFGLGVVCSAFERERTEKEAHDDLKAGQLQLGTLDEARRRAEEARDRAHQDVTRLEEQLRTERHGRREREGRAERDLDAARRCRSEADAVVAKAAATTEEAAARLERESARAREAERRVRELRRELADRDHAEGQAHPAAVPDPTALADAARAAHGLAASLDRLLHAAQAAVPPPPPVDPPASREARRTRVPRPPGLETDTVPALDAMLRTRGVMLVVDGYNVSMRGWPDARPTDQRESVLGALERLHLRLRCDVIVVFDGSDVQGLPPRRRAGVRVLFSAADEDADPVVIREVEALNVSRPAIVASSDRWVHDHAEAVGATVVSADTLLALLRQ